MKRTVACILSLLLLSGTTLAQQPRGSRAEPLPFKSYLRLPERTGSIKGTVNPRVEGAWVRVVHTRTNSLYYARTDADGRFTLENLPAGRYRLRITKLDYEPLEVASVHVESGRTLRRDFRLRGMLSW